MKNLFQPSFNIAAIAISVVVNVLLIGALEAHLTRHQAVAVNYVQLPSVTVVAKRNPVPPTQLAAASTAKVL